MFSFLCLDNIQAWLQGRALEACARVEAPLPPAALAEVYASAHAFLLGYPDYPGVPGKAYEYLAAGRPVLLSAPPGETRGLLEEAGLARLVESPEQGARLMGELLEQHRAGVPGSRPDPTWVRGFRRREQLARGVKLLEAFGSVSVPDI